MSDDLSASSFDDDDLPYARPRPTWRDQAGELAEAYGLTPRRVAAALAALAVAALVTWRLLAPAPAPAEMSLPYTEGASPAGAEPAGAGPTTATAGEVAPVGAAPAAGVAGAPDPAGASATGASGAGAASASELVVHVAGAVAQPGVQRLGTGARVVDAVDRAGGATPDAELARINLAAPLQDGQQVYVPRLGEPSPPAVATGAAPGGLPPSGEPGDATGPVDLNAATAEQLDTLPGVGPATAEAIIAHRQAEGPFTSVDQLLDVRGIGDAKLADLRDLVTV
jgi:competence protein ComEA